MICEFWSLKEILLHQNDLIINYYITHIHQLNENEIIKTTYYSQLLQSNL